WPGGSDNISDGAAANVGYIRPWNKTTDSKHNSDGSLMTEGGCPTGTVIHTWDLANAGTLVGQLMTYAAKIDKLYEHGWDGVWSDNAYARFDTNWTNGLQTALTALR